ncbi:MAG: AI-2E family transporter [Actinobacteria bacterium]|nr:AI-2E family transporter [Actinomycetota bacterium]MBI3688809.1 AI-2E family transporter [Actinomycetota bacterium]
MPSAPSTPADAPRLPDTGVPGRRPVDSVSWGVRVAAEWSARLALIALAGYLVLRALIQVRLVAFAFLVAMLLTALLYPLMASLRARGVHRSLSALLVLLLAVTALGLVGWFVTAQVTSNAESLTGQLTTAGNHIRGWLTSGPLHIRDDQFANLTKNVTDAIGRNQGTLASGLFATASTAVEAVGGILLTTFSTFFLLRDGPLIWSWLVGLFPAPARGDVRAAGGLGWQTLSGYVRGIVVVALADAVSVTVVLLVVRVPLAIPLGVLVFLAAFIPLVGLTVIGALCVLLALISHGPGAALVVLVSIVLLVQAEGHLLHPLVMSRAVRIHPLAVVLAVTAGTLVGGIQGALIAVPVVAVLHTLGRYLRAPRSHAAV